MLPDLVQKDDAVPDDHARKGNHADDGNESYRLPCDKERQNRPDETERPGHDGDDELGYRPQLEDEDHKNEEDHDRHGLENVLHRLVAPFGGSVFFKRVSVGEACLEGSEVVIVEFLHEGVCHDAVLAVSAERDRRLQVSSPDGADFILIGNIGKLPERHVASVSYMDRHGGKVGQLGRILSFELEGNRDELVALVRFSDLVAGKLRVQVERYGIVVDAELADAVLIDFQLDGRHFFRPVKACIHDVRILPHDVERFDGKLGCLLIVLADQAEHDRVIGRS